MKGGSSASNANGPVVEVGGGDDDAALDCLDGRASKVSETI